MNESVWIRLCPVVLHLSILAKKVIFTRAIWFIFSSLPRSVHLFFLFHRVLLKKKNKLQDFLCFLEKKNIIKLSLSRKKKNSSLKHCVGKLRRYYFHYSLIILYLMHAVKQKRRDPKLHIDIRASFHCGWIVTRGF